MSQQTIKREFQGILMNIDSLYREYLEINYDNMDFNALFHKLEELKKQADYYTKKYGELKTIKENKNTGVSRTKVRFDTLKNKQRGEKK